jgi:hypothetical protein
MAGEKIYITNQTVTINKGVINFVYKNPRGPAGQHLNRMAERVVIAAKIQVPKRTGQMAAQIGVERRVETPGGQSLQIVSANKNSAYVHEGTAPHLIKSRKANGFIKFNSKGVTVFTRLVRHPGSKPNRFITDNVKLIMI